MEPDIYEIWIDPEYNGHSLYFVVPASMQKFPLILNDEVEELPGSAKLLCQINLDGFTDREVMLVPGEERR